MFIIVKNNPFTLILISPIKITNNNREHKINIEKKLIPIFSLILLVAKWKGIKIV